MTEEEEQLKSYNPKIQFLIVEMSRKHYQTSNIYEIYRITRFGFRLYIRSCVVSHVSFATAVTDIDTSGIHALDELHRSLQKRDIQV